MTQIESIEHMQWKFPNEPKFKSLKKYRDYELNQIRKIVRNNSHITSNWFSISSDKWFNDITFLLKYRRKLREINQQIKEH